MCSYNTHTHKKKSAHASPVAHIKYYALGNNKSFHFNDIKNDHKILVNKKDKLQKSRYHFFKNSHTEEILKDLLQNINSGHIRMGDCIRSVIHLFCLSTFPKCFAIEMYCS